MVISLVRAAGAHATSGTVTATLSAAPTDGNLLVATFGDNTGTSVMSVPSGWTSLFAGIASNNTMIMSFYKVAASSPASLSLTPSSGSSIDLHLMEFSGIGTGAVVDVANGTTSSGVTVTAISPTTGGGLSGVGDLVIAGMYGTGSAGTVTHGTGFTSATTSSRMFSGWGVDTDQTQKTDNMTWTNGTKCAAFIAAISPTALTTVSFYGWGVPL